MPTPFTAMSFNLRNMRARDGDDGWEHRVEAVGRAIHLATPDILGTQEGYMPQIESLKSMLPEYGCVATGRDNGADEGETCALFYLHSRWKLLSSGTFWFSETPHVAGSHHWTHHLRRICTWATLEDNASGWPVTVCCVHLDHESVSARANSIDMLMEPWQFMPGAPATGTSIVMGDFNMTPDDTDLNRLLAPKTGWNDSWIKACSGTTLSSSAHDGTFHDFTGRTDMGRIDYILTRGGIKTRTARIWNQRDSATGRFASDHFPISAELELLPEA